jgi:hypothetical protein
MSDLLACEVAYPHPYHGWDDLPYFRAYHLCPGVPANDVVLRWVAEREADPVLNLGGRTRAAWADLLIVSERYTIDSAEYRNALSNFERLSGFTHSPTEVVSARADR